MKTNEAPTSKLVGIKRNYSPSSIAEPLRRTGEAEYRSKYILLRQGFEGLFPSPLSMGLRPWYSAKENKKGVINLFVIFGVGFLALGLSLSVATGTLTETSKNRNTASGDQAFYTAEAGVSEGAYQYVNAISSYTGGDPLPINSISGGSINVTPLTWPYVLIRSKAANGLSDRNVVKTATLFPEGQAFDYGVYAQDNLAFGGNIEVNGNIFANNGITFNGNSSEINGDAYSPVPIEDQDNINGDAITSTDTIPPPEILSAPYKDAAILQGTFFTSPSDAETYLNNLERENIIYVESAVKTKIQGSNTNLKGSLVTQSGLDLTGGTYTAQENYVAIFVNGDLKIAGGATINGVVYVKGSTSFGGGNNVINGSLVSAGGASVTDLTGSATVNYDENLANIWPNLTGLDTTTDEPPKIILWGEE